MIGALYVHVPFCARKCAYCDFASAATPAGDARMAAFVDEMVRQLRALSSHGVLASCRTAYVGGGTPSFLGPELLGRLLGEMRAAAPGLVELTFEANPDSASDALLDAAVEAGATRVSMGVQSLADAELAELGRLHTAGQAVERVRAAVASGLDVSVDLMCAIPRQTYGSWEETLAGTVGLGMDHVSIYPLVIEEGTAFDARYGEAEVPWNDEDVQAERMERAEAVLGAAGFARYEVASYEREGHACAHNIAYWTGVPYVGLGAGASSMLGPSDYAELRRACRGLPEAPDFAARVRVALGAGGRASVEFLTARQAWAEDLMLGMRLTRGVDAGAVPVEVAEGLAARGLVERSGGRLRPTHEGWLLGNELFGALWELAEGPVAEVACEGVALR